MRQVVTHAAGKGEVEDVRSDLDALEQLINLLIRHLLAKLGEDVSQLSSTNVTVSFLIEDLETTDKLLYIPKKTKSRLITPLGEGVEDEMGVPGVPAGLKPSGRFKIVKKLL